jgi:hypothetical protein
VVVGAPGCVSSRRGSGIERLLGRKTFEVESAASRRRPRSALEARRTRRAGRKTAVALAVQLVRPVGKRRMRASLPSVGVGASVSSSLVVLDAAARAPRLRPRG